MNNRSRLAINRELLNKVNWKGIGTVLFAFLLTRMMVFTVTYLSMSELPVRSGDIYWRAIPQNILADGLVRWDSGFYRDIVKGGYQSVAGIHNTAFFPLYPMLVRLLSKIIGHVYLSGLLISNLMFLISLFYLYALVKHEYRDDDTAGRAVFYLACAPTAFFFSAMYSESTFLAFLIACLYYARTARWGWAALTGAAASAARIPGVFVAVFILLEGFSRAGIRLWSTPWSKQAQFELLKEDIRRIRFCWQSILAAILSTTGLLIYMIYLKNTFGDPLAFIHQQYNWYGEFTGNPFVRFFVDAFNNIHFNWGFWAGKINVNVLQDIVATLIFLPLVIAVIIKMRPSYGIFTLLLFLLPIYGGNVVSMRRYILMLVPCFMLLALWGKHPWVDRLVIGISLPLQAYLTILFTHWYFAG
jgi:Gpi18-like mannosyltransferase